MSDRFDPTHKIASKQDAAIDALAGVRNDVVTGGGRRRRWSSADKARIVRESLKPGAVVSEVAQRHGLTRWQLYDWRRKVLAATAKGTGPGDQARPARPKRNGSVSKAVEALPAFAPVVMATPAIPLQPTIPEASLVEIAIGGVSVRVRGVVDVEGLVAVLNAVRRAS
ncbi:MAG: transposase [Bradyrhizobiaceae bacterium]|nr:transposase [Bradyrhizobiaceae bacterium]